MKVQIRRHDSPLTEALRTHALRRLGFALGRFGESVGNVIVRLSDNHGRGGDTNHRCEIEVDLPYRVKVEAAGDDALIVIDRAADRASRSVARALARDRERREAPPRPRGKGTSKA